MEQQSRKEARASVARRRIREEIRSDNINGLAFIEMHRVNLAVITSDPHLKSSYPVRGWVTILAMIAILGTVFGPVIVKDLLS